MPTESYENFEWDSEKRRFNLAKHNIDFADAIRVFDGKITRDTFFHPPSGEIRSLSIGWLDGREITVIYTQRENRRRIISARRARHDERERYHAEVIDD